MIYSATDPEPGVSNFERRLGAKERLDDLKRLKAQLQGDVSFRVLLSFAGASISIVASRDTYHTTRLLRLALLTVATRLCASASHRLFARLEEGKKNEGEGGSRRGCQMTSPSQGDAWGGRLTTSTRTFGDLRKRSSTTTEGLISAHFRTRKKPSFRRCSSRMKRCPPQSSTAGHCGKRSQLLPLNFAQCRNTLWHPRSPHRGVADAHPNDTNASSQ